MQLWFDISLMPTHSEATDRVTPVNGRGRVSRADAVGEAAQNTAPEEQPLLAKEVPAWKRLLYLGGAGLFFVIGAVGAVLPVLPATPFLLLTSYFLVRSSPKLNRRLLRSRFLGPILTDWQVHGGVRPDVKAQSVVFVVLAVGLTIFLTGYAWLPTVIVVALASVGIFVILRLPSIRP